MIATAIALTALAAPTAAQAADRDHDHMRDSWEKHFKLNTHKNDARKDKDRDGLQNVQEFRSGTNPRRKDSDDDGVRDNREGAGTIKSFDAATGVLVIDLFDSDQDLTGKVDPATTEIECEDDQIEGEHGDNRRDDDEAGDDSRQSRDGSDDGDRSGDDGDRSGSNSGPSENSGPGSDGDPEDVEREHGDEDDDEPNEACDANSLTAGTTVKEAELRDGSDVFTEIELIAR
jgi:hypothetical protein